MTRLEKFLTKSRLWQYCHHLIWADKLAQNTVHRKLASLKKFCQWAVEKGLITKNPFEEGEEGKERREGKEKMRRKVEAWVKLAVPVLSVAIGLVVLRVSLTKLLSLPYPSKIPEAIPLPRSLPANWRVLSQTSGFRENLSQISQIGGLTASESSSLAKLAKLGQLGLPENLGIEAKEITLKTTDGYDGNITFNPDGNGVLNLLFEGQSTKEIANVGGFVNIQNANLTEGNLIWAGVANDQTEFNFFQFQGGTDLTDRFTVDGQGNIKTSGSLNLDTGQISSSKNLVFSPQDQPTLILAPKQSLLKGNLAISGQIFAAGLGLFGTTGEKLPQTFDFSKELTIEFEFLTGNQDLIIKFNLNKEENKYYQAVWQTDKTFAVQACDPNCATLGSTAFCPFEEQSWHHGRIHINDSFLTWELDLSAQKVTVPVQIKALPLLSAGDIQFSQNFLAIANLKISQGNNIILTSGHGQVGGNLEVKGGLRVGELADQSASTHICYNANGELAECAADYSEWYPVSDKSTGISKNQIDQMSDKSDLSAIRNTDSTDLSGSLVSITNIPNPVDDSTARYLAAASKVPYDGNILGVLADSRLGANGKKLAENYQPLVLAGRVPVKVSDVNGPIEVGDAITSSDIAGVGIKATEAGIIIGKALEPSSQLGKLGKLENILVFVNPGWWEPEPDKPALPVDRSANIRKNQIDQMTDLSDISDKSDLSAIRNTDSADSTDLSGFIDSTDKANFSNNEAININSLLIERLRTTGQEETADQLITQAQEKITTLENEFGNLLVRVEELETKTGTDSQSLGETIGENPSLISENQINTDLELIATNSATPGSGEKPNTNELLAQVDQFIKELQEISVPTTTNNIVNDINISEDIGIYEEMGKGEVGSEKKQDTRFSLPDLPALTAVRQAQAGSLLTSNSPTSQFLFPNLTVTGSTSLGSTTIAGNLLVDSSLQLAANSLNSLNNTLYLQNYGFGGVDILAGKITIDKTGNLVVAENATIEKDLTVKRSLFANLLKPLEGEEVIVEGNLKTTGSGKFNKIVIAAAKTLGIPALNTPGVEIGLHPWGEDKEIKTNATAGTAVLPAGETELTITNYSITDESLIYLTPLSPTENKVLFVKAKKGPIDCPLASELEELPNILSPLSTPSCLPQPGYFTVGIDEVISYNIEFNWWVIN